MHELLVETKKTMVRPFLKWAGGKYRLVSLLHSHLPPRTHLVEPFVGAGALFLNTDHPNIILNDINNDLINVYQQLKTTGSDFIHEAKQFFNDRHNRSTRYYRLRARFNRSQDPWERALLFLYLNRHGYNGLCRYNLKGLYNVPFGDYQRPYFPEAELIAFCQRAKQAEFHCQDFVSLMKRFLQQRSLKHIVFYCDPPYAPLSTTANFTGYAAQRFTLHHQEELAELASALARKGAIVLISNHDTPFTRKIYHEAKCLPLQVSRTISCQPHSRHKVAELIACYGKTRSE